MSLPYNVARVLTYFQRRIYAYDLQFTMVNHAVSCVKGEQYSFIGVLLPPTDKVVQFDSQGEIGQGNITIYVSKKVNLYVADAWPNAQAGARQTIVVFNGDEYRVLGYSNRADDGLHRKYTLERYIPNRSVVINGNS